MPMNEDRPAGTKRDEVLRALEKASEEDIEIERRAGSMVVRIKTVSRKASTGDGKGKWARVAEEMAEENLLRDGLGDRLRKNIREFRGNFSFERGR